MQNYVQTLSDFKLEKKLVTESQSELSAIEVVSLQTGYLAPLLPTFHNH